MPTHAPVQSLRISFFLNERALTATVAPDMTALELLRDELGLTGTKESCAEGDCGSCTVALGQIENGRAAYRALNACLLPAPRLHGRHLVTIEGLAEGERLHLLQRLMLDHHATQCGWCTPGVIMSLFCLLASGGRADDEALAAALEGNLCRCTGYETIRLAGRAAAKAVARARGQWRRLVLPGYVGDVERRLKAFTAAPTACSEARFAARRTLAYDQPHSLDELFTFWEAAGPEQARLLNGGTDLLVAMNIRGEHPERLIDLSAVGELDGIEAAGAGLRIGGTATLARIQASPLVKARQPELAAAITRIGSAQVRNAATLAGNVANASPVADGAVALLGLNARLHLASRRGERTLAVEEFYLDYKKTALGCGELIAAIGIPAAAGHCSFIKAGKRVAVDIAGVNSFCQLRLHKGRVASCRVAFGGVAKYPRLAGRCSEFLNGRQLDGATIADAAAIAAAEFAPISDIRGSAAYRSLLVRRQVESHLEAAAAGGGR